MTRRAGQIFALLSLLVLLGVVVAYQFFDQQKLRGDVLTGGYEGTVVCGNGMIESDEQCDDGNVLSGDGCSEICMLEEAQTEIPDTEPDTETPDTETPDGETPDTQTPDAETPDSEVPDTETPDAVTPDTETPDTEIPDTEIPDTEIPDIQPSDPEVPDTEVTEVESDLPPISLEENVPVSSTLENGLLVNRYFTVYGQRTVLDGLQLPQYVPSFRTKVQWISDESNPVAIEIEDPNAARTAFMAPSQETELRFTLEVGPVGSFTPVAQYVFSVVSPLVLTADANRDGIYDFTDLLDLLQNWQSYGSQATQVLAVILSRYQE